MKCIWSDSKNDLNCGNHPLKRGEVDRWGKGRLSNAKMCSCVLIAHTDIISEKDSFL